MQNESCFIDENNCLHLLGKKIEPNSSVRFNLIETKLYTHSTLEVPIIVERAKEKGPIVLITSGIHGDEVNGIEIVRQLIEKKINVPKIGTIICIPILNVIGFSTRNRTFPDNKDLNRVFPGSKRGSMASQVAFQLVHGVLPIVDFVMDFHTGGGSKFNLPQIRIETNNLELERLAKIFHPPFIVESKIIPKSFRESCKKLNIPTLLFEGGKTNTISESISTNGIEGMKKILLFFNMLRDEFAIDEKENQSIVIKKARWIRTKHSGLLQVKKKHGNYIQKGELIATVTDPFGEFKYKIKSNLEGYIINVNEDALVFEGDAIFHISTQ